MAKKGKRSRAESVSSIDSTLNSSPSRALSTDPVDIQSGEAMKVHVAALHKLSKKGGCNGAVKDLIEKLVSLFSIQDQQFAGHKEEVTSQLALVQSKADELEANVQEQIREMKNLVEDLRKRTDALETKPPVSFEEGYRVRSLVLSGLQIPTPQHIPNSQYRVHSLKAQVEDILAYLGVNYIVLDFFQMGLHLVKVRFGTREAAQEVLKQAHKLRHSAFDRVHIRPSLTVEERAVRSTNLRNALHEKKERESRGEFVFIRHNSNFIEFSVEHKRSTKVRNAPSSAPKQPSNLAGI